MSHRCLLWGGYSHGNVGDELTLAVALQDARAEFGGSVAILSPNPERTRRQFRDAEVLPYKLRKPARPVRWWMRARKWAQRLPGIERGREPKYRLRDQTGGDGVPRASWIDAVESSEMLHLVGGGYLADLFPLEVYLFPLVIARAAGVPISTSPIGIGPITSSRSASRVAEALGSASVQVRDAASMEFCRRHRIPATQRPDDGFRVAEVLPGLRATRRPDGGSRGLRVGICATVQEGSGGRAERRRLEDWWIRLLRGAHSLEGIDLTGFCFHSDLRKDYSLTRSTFQAAELDPELVAPPRDGFRDAIRDLSELDVVVTARFHAAVVAGALGIPCIAVAHGAYSVRKIESVEEVAPRTTRPLDPFAVGAEGAVDLLESLLSGRRQEAGANRGGRSPSSGELLPAPGDS